MTTKNEMVYSLKRTKLFLFKLLDPKETPKVPKHIRKEASSLLKHYPFDMHIDEAFKEREEG